MKILDNDVLATTTEMKVYNYMRGRINSVENSLVCARAVIAKACNISLSTFTKTSQSLHAGGAIEVIPGIYRKNQYRIKIDIDDTYHIFTKQSAFDIYRVIRQNCENNSPLISRKTLALSCNIKVGTVTKLTNELKESGYIAARIREIQGICNNEENEVTLCNEFTILK